MKKSDLEPRMVVQLRNGEFYMFVGDAFINKARKLSTIFYEDDLTDKNNRELDVIEIFNKIQSINYFNDHCCRSNLIWERPEKTYMTIDEIEKKLGINNLCIVSEK